MLPAASVRTGGSRQLASSGPAPPENTKDIIMIYEEDAEEWALYLKEVFLHVVKREAVLLYCLENYSFWDFELLSLNSYKCKLLILSNGLLKDLSPKKCQFLEKVLHSPESVVTLLCGVTSSDQLYKLLNIPGGRWEMSTEQEPQDYIAVIESIILRDSEDYLEVNIPTDLGVEHSREISKRKEIEELSKASRDTIPLAMVLPTEIPCEMFMIVKDKPGQCRLSLVEQATSSVEMRKQMKLFVTDKNCLVLKEFEVTPKLAVVSAYAKSYKNICEVFKLEISTNVYSEGRGYSSDFPAGSLNVRVYCDGVMKATTEMKYCTTAKAVENLLGATCPGDGVCQKDTDELDDILSSVFKHEIPYYEFPAFQPEIDPQKERTHFKELPTLLHCAAKFGLKNLAIHLLQCSGATWASKMKNFEGSDPAHIAERHGHKELKKIFEDFSLLILPRIILFKLFKNSRKGKETCANESDQREANVGKKMKAFQMDSSTLVPDTFKKKMFQMLQFSKRFGKLVDGKKLVNPFLKSVENLLMENSQKAALFYLASSFRATSHRLPNSTIRCNMVNIRCDANFSGQASVVEEAPVIFDGKQDRVQWLYC
ncbi:hypothetical protein PANDA_004616 [Ailuropoda melanoleuca]|uniref:B-cell scaffold protein with ankyrin repeats n=1 Tax=Ailuropoda melanoleuca TaxID=9646 RepID=D2H4B5_AILME|nr:hypothetical protein PANDA_004616 [Ailuropoda melanoleuca]